MSWRLTVRSEFSAAHSLRHYQGKCEHLHGHNFGVEAAVEGTILHPDTGMLLDFATLKKALAEILSRLDHTLLNERVPFTGINPSSELLAQYIGQQMQVFLQNCAEAANARLAFVTVSEKASQSATWLPENQDIGQSHAANL